MKKKNKKTMYIVFLALILFVGIGYALLSANLKINGIGRIADITWDVHFENAEATENSTVEPTTAPSAPAASKLQEISYDVTFDTPGQVYEFTVDVVNGGTIDAMIENFTSKIKIGDADEVAIKADKSNLPTYLDYDVTYEDGVAIKNNHELKHDTSETIKVTVTFKADITNEQLLEAKNKTIKLNVGLDYKQADGTEESVQHLVSGGRYTLNMVDYDAEGQNSVWLNQTVPGSITLYKTPELAMANWESISGVVKPIYLKHTILNNVVKESYVDFIISEEMEQADERLTAGTYSLRGGIDESSLSTDEQEIFKANQTTLQSAFGTENCHNSYYSFYCETSDFYASINEKGNVSVILDEGSCSVNDDGSSSCLQDD